MRSLLLAILLTACSHATLSPEQRQNLGVISAASFLGDSFTLDVSSRSMIRAREQVLDARPWGIDAAFGPLFAAEVKARGGEFRPLTLDPAAVKKAQAVREGRWKKTDGVLTQALLELVLDAAEASGIQTLVLLAPFHEPDRFALYRGVMGTTCDGGGLDSQAFVYFFARASWWSVKTRSKLSETNVDPSLTVGMPYGKCAAVAELTEPLRALEDPVKRTMARMVEALFGRLGWAKRGESAIK